MFWEHYLGNTKPNLLVCIPEQVYDAISKSPKKLFWRILDGSFSEPSNLLAESLNFPWHAFS